MRRVASRWGLCLLTATGLAAGLAGHASARPASKAAWIQRTIARMTLREEVGQLFEINGFGASVRDSTPAMVQLNRSFYRVDNITQLIKKFHPGGMIYFTWAGNLNAPAQIASLSNGIQRTALSQSPRVPMVISTDQEEGEVLRIGSPATVFGGNMPLGATRSAQFARQAALITGRELRAMGINVDNAPVVDVNVDPLLACQLGLRLHGEKTLQRSEETYEPTAEQWGRSAGDARRENLATSVKACGLGWL